MANNNADIELLAGLSIDSSEAEILKAIKIIEKRLKANINARIKLNADIDETVIKNTIEKLQNILKGKDLKIETKSSIEAITKEVDAMGDIVTVAKKASKEKLDFAKANERVRDSADDTTDAVNRERNAMNTLDDVDAILNNINRYGQQGNSVFQRFGTTFRAAFSAYSLANLMERALDGVISAGRKAIETVKELNKESTSLIMATGAERNVVEQYMSDYNALGQELGFITSDISQAADSYLRQGMSVADTNELIKDSLVLAKVSELETADSTEYLTAIMQAYKLKATEVIDVVDRLASVDLNAAVDAGGIAQAMSKTAVSAQLAGVSIDQLIAMVTTVGEVSQAGMSEVGNSIRTIFARMKDVADGNLSRIGDDGTIENLSNIEGTLGAIGIQLRASNNEFRNMFTVLDETADKWVDMSSVQKAAVAEAYSGIRQSEKFNILMENWDKVRKYIEVSEQSSGVATEKFDAYLDSIEAKTNSLKASLENLATTTISDKLLISILETSKEIVDLTADTGILKSALIGLGTGATAYTFTHLARFMNESAQGLSNFSAALNLVNNGVTANDMQALVDLSHGLSNSQMHLLLSTNNLTDAQKIALMVANGTERELAEQQLQTWGLINAQNNATASTVTLGSAMRGLVSTMIANPIFLVTTAVTLGITVFNLYQSAVEKAEKKLNDLKTTLNDTTTEMESVQGEIDNINKQIDDLLAKDTLSITDENDLKRLREENEELRARKVLLDAKREEQAKEVNTEIEKRYEKDFLSDENYHYDENTGVGEYYNSVDYLDIQIKRANVLLDLKRNLTEEEKEELNAIKSYVTEQSNALVELADGYEPITEEQKTLKKGWEELIAKSSEVVGVYAGTIPDITDRLVEKFATDIDTEIVDKTMELWLESLSDEDKKVLIRCEIEDATVEDLKAYLLEQKDEMESATKAESTASFNLVTFTGNISEITSAYDTLSSAIEEYNTNGAYSLETMSKLLNLKPEYLALLIDENGQLKLNEEGLRSIVEAQLEQAQAEIYETGVAKLNALAKEKAGEASLDASKNMQASVLGIHEETEALKENTMEALENASIRAQLSGVDQSDIDAIVAETNAQVKAIQNAVKGLSFNIGGVSGGFKKVSSSAKKTTETFNWIETAISRVQRAITNLNKTVNATYKKWSTRNNAIAQEFSTIIKEIELQNNAYNGYMQKANSIGLSDFYKSLVHSGSLRIEDIADETLQKQIKTYKEYYEKALSCSDAIEDLKANLADLAKTKFDNINSEYDNKMGEFNHRIEMLEGFVDQAEEMGHLVSQKYYEALLESQGKNVTLLQSQYKDLIKSFNEGVESGAIEQYSEAWYEMYFAINDVEQELQDATTALIKYKNEMMSLDWESFDMLQNMISSITQESEFLIELLGDKLSDGFGKLNNNGLAVQGLHAVNYNTYMAQADKYAAELLEVNKLLAEDPYNQTIVDRRNELLELQREAILNAEAEKDAIHSLISDCYNEMINSLDELISKRKEALNSAKDLHDYEKTISKQSNEVASIQKQIIAYSGDNSEETRAIIQKLQKNLVDAQENLQESEYNKWKSDQEAMLDSLQNETELWVNSRLDNIDGLIQEAIDATNTNAVTISTTLHEVADEVGYTITTEMASIWETSTVNYDEITGIMTTISNVVSVYSNNFNSAMTTVQKTIDGMSSYMTEMTNSLNATAISNANAIAQAVKDAIANQKQGSISSGSSSTTVVTTPSTSTKPSSSSSNSSSSSSSSSSNEKYWMETPTTNPTSNANPNTQTAEQIAAQQKAKQEAAKKAAEEAKKKAEAAKRAGYYVVKNGSRVKGPYGSSGEAWSKVGLYGGNGVSYWDGYAKGTRNAEAGIREVSENGDEIILTNDGSAVIAHDRQLWNFNGGETVYTAQESKELIANEGNVEPYAPSISSISGDVLEQIKKLKISDRIDVGDYSLPTIPRVDTDISSTMNALSKVKSTASTVNNNNQFQIELVFPNATNYESIVTTLQTDKRVEKIVQQMTIGTAMGNNSLTKRIL